jgi:hypothetical protein
VPFGAGQLVFASDWPFAARLDERPSVPACSSPAPSQCEALGTSFSSEQRAAIERDTATRELLRFATSGA